MTRVHDLFKARGASPAEILEAAQYALNIQESEGLEFDVSGAQKILSLLAKLSTSKEGPTFQRLSAGAMLAQLVCSFGKKKADVAKVLLHSSYASSLCALTSAAVTAALEADVPLEPSCMSINGFLRAIDDAAKLSYKDGGGSRVKGRVLIGEEAVPVMLDVLLLLNDVQDEDIQHILPACTLATEYLAIMVQNSPTNCKAFVSAPQLHDGTALTTLLQRCGNYSIQLDVCEILYHCFVEAEKIRNNKIDYDGDVTKDFPELKAFSLSSPLKKLASRDMQEMNFPKELRSVVMTYNKNLKNGARVTTLSAKEIKIAGESAIMPPGNWVDFGTTSLTLNLILDSPAAAGGGGPNGKGNSIPIIFSQEENNLTKDGFGSQSQPDDVYDEAMPAIEEFFYSDMVGAKISVHQSNGTATLSFSLPKLSQDLLDAGYGGSYAAVNGMYTILVSFEAADLVNMCNAARLVAVALESAGISLASVCSNGAKAVGAGTNGVGGAEADTSQRPKKVSMAVALPPQVKIAGLRNPPPKTNVFVQMQRMKQNTNTTNSTAAGVSGVSRNAPPPAAPAPVAAPPAAAEVEDKEPNPPAKKRQWKQAKRSAAKEEPAKPLDMDGEPAMPAEPAAKQKPEKKNIPAATGAKGKTKKVKAPAAEPDAKNDNNDTVVPKGKDRGAGSKNAPVKKPSAAATKKAAAAAAAAAATKQKKKTSKSATLEDPIENSTLPSLPLEDGNAVQNKFPVVISEADRPFLEGDALPDWMLAPAPSPAYQSQYAASPQQQQQQSPFYESSDDEDDDEFAMLKAYNKAAAEEEAEAVPVAHAEKKKLAAAGDATAADPYAFTTNNEEQAPKAVNNKDKKRVAAPQKPPAVQNKRQPAAAAKKKAAAAAKKKPTAKKTAAAKKPPAPEATTNAAGGRKQPRRAAAAQAATKTKKQLNSQSINLQDTSSDDDDLDKINTNHNNTTAAAAGGGATKYNGVYGEVNVFVEDDSDDGWVPGTQAPPSRLLLEDNTESGEENIEEGEDGRMFGNEYALNSHNIPVSAARPVAGGVGALAGLKAALADDNNAPAPAGHAENGGNTAMAAVNVLRKRVSPSSAVKKGRGRLSNMLPVGGGTGAGSRGKGGSGSRGKTSGGGVKTKTQAVKQTPAKLQTETPAGGVGKKRDIGSEEPKAKPKARTISKAKAALVAGAAAAAAAQKENQKANAKSNKKGAAVAQQLESNTTSEDEHQEEEEEEEQQQQQMEKDEYAFDYTVAELKKSATAPAPTAAAGAAEKKKPVAAKSKAAAAAKTNKPNNPNKKSTTAAARSVWDDVDMEELLEEDEDQEEDINKAVDAVLVPKKKGKNTSAPAKKPNNQKNNKNNIKKKEISYDDFALDEPDEDFEIVLDSESEEDEEEVPVARGGKKRGRGGNGNGGGAAGGDAAALLQVLQGRLGGNALGLDSDEEEDDDEDVDDDEDDDGLGSSGFAQVQAAIAQAMAARQRKAQRARAAQVKKLEKETKGEMTKVQNEVQAGVVAAEAKAAEVLAVVEEKLSENEDEIRAVQAEYELKMSELSEKQRVLAAEAERVAQEAARHVAEAKNRGKRKLHEAFAVVKGKLEEGKRRIQRAAKRAKRMPDLASLLVPLFASG